MCTCGLNITHGETLMNLIQWIKSVEVHMSCLKATYTWTIQTWGEQNRLISNLSLSFSQALSLSVSWENWIYQNWLHFFIIDPDVKTDNRILTQQCGRCCWLQFMLQNKESSRMHCSSLYLTPYFLGSAHFSCCWSVSFIAPSKIATLVSPLSAH